MRTLRFLVLEFRSQILRNTGEYYPRQVEQSRREHCVLRLLARSYRCCKTMPLISRRLGCDWILGRGKSSGRSAVFKCSRWTVRQNQDARSRKATRICLTRARPDEFIGGLPEPCKTVARFLIDTGGGFVLRSYLRSCFLGPACWMRGPPAPSARQILLPADQGLW